jgi:hypothetical protein
MRRRNLYEHGRWRDMWLSRGFCPELHWNEMYRHKTRPLLRFIFVRLVVFVEHDDLSKFVDFIICLCVSCTCAQVTVWPRGNRGLRKKNAVVRREGVGAKNVRPARSPGAVRTRFKIMIKKSVCNEVMSVFLRQTRSRDCARKAWVAAIKAKTWTSAISWRTRATAASA